MQLFILRAKDNHLSSLEEITLTGLVRLFGIHMISDFLFFVTIMFQFSKDFLIYHITDQIPCERDPYVAISFDEVKHQLVLPLSLSLFLFTGAKCMLWLWEIEVSLFSECLCYNRMS